MCTAISFSSRHHYFGRTLDLEYHYNEQVTITPRNFPFAFRHCKALPQHYAMIGMAIVEDNVPLYYEATNECGVSIAGLIGLILCFAGCRLLKVPEMQIVTDLIRRFTKRG